MVIGHDKAVEESLAILGQEFFQLNWNFSPEPDSGSNELVSHWLGKEDEEVMVNVFQGRHLSEQFHRQDFFFIHFAYRGSYQALSAKYNNRITIREGDCYIGHPYSGYAAKVESDKECIIVGVLIRKDIFIWEFLSSLSADTAMLRFFLAPHKNRFAEEFVHMTLPAESPIWKLLGLMVVEYAHRTEFTQQIIKPLTMALSMYLSAEYKWQSLPENGTLTDKILGHIETCSDTATLSSTARHFGYHPVYISRLLPQKTGKTFSELLLEVRMHKAKLLLNNTDLSIEKIATMLGYSNSSNFYKFFKSYYGHTPRKK
ncbi:helix-turn-helix transcriptional regulator [Megasphaera elsdenii]|uniref:helix-turn-helix transcriptional regulator n=1 Tax=Megasphaera elsdenii TaxID=907 RepID=UPI0036F2966D